MLTSIEVLNANCSYCLHSAREALLKYPGVQDVRIHQSDGYLQVEHNLRDPTELTSVLGRQLRGWTVAGNGEVEMTHTSPTVVDNCKVHPDNSLGITTQEVAPTRRTIGETAM